MHLFSVCASFPVIFSTVLHARGAVASRSSKRGLCFTPNKQWPQDNYIWPREPSVLAWYYNYGPTPSPVYSNRTQQDFEFVPMMWTAPSDLSDTTFLSTVRGLVADKGVNISHVMAFNEPDGSLEQLGSALQPAVAAQAWVRNIIPLQDAGIRAGLPACTGGWGGVPWLTQFLGNCSILINEEEEGEIKNCTYDFVPVHWYGNFEGLASHIGTYSAAFPDTPIWVTEYNAADEDLPTTQAFVRTATEYLGRLDSVERHALFGAFRSPASNVGPNAAMLSAGGQLTDIGAMYLDVGAGGAPPDSTEAPSRVGRTGWFSVVGWYVAAAYMAVALV